MLESGGRGAISLIWNRGSAPGGNTWLGRQIYVNTRWSNYFPQKGPPPLSATLQAGFWERAEPHPSREGGGGAAARRLWEAAGAAAPPAMELSFGVAGQRPGNLPAAAAVASCVRVSAPYGAGTARHLRSPHPRRGRLGTRAAESRLCALRPPSVSRSQAPSDRGAPCPSASFGACSSAPCCW